MCFLEFNLGQTTKCFIISINLDGNVNLKCQLTNHSMEGTMHEKLNIDSRLHTTTQKNDRYEDCR